MEEVGLYPHRLKKLGSFLANSRRADIRGHVFLATELEERALPADETEFITCEWLTVSEVEGKIQAGDIENKTLLAAWTFFKLDGA